VICDTLLRAQLHICQCRPVNPTDLNILDVDARAITPRVTRVDVRTEDI
jgi:hypothetical protein